MRKLFNYSFFLAILFFPALAFSMTVKLEPGSMRDNKQADMNLSGLIVHKVQWEDGALMMPITISNNRNYYDVKLISRELYLKMEDCFINGCPQSLPSDKPDLPMVKAEIVKRLNSKFRVSNVEISFDNSLTVSVGIMAENYPDGTFWLSYPQSIDFASPILKEHTDNVVFGAYAAENPHLTIERSEPTSSSKNYYLKQEKKEEGSEAENNEANALFAPSITKTPVYVNAPEDEGAGRKKNKRRKSKARKIRKKNSYSPKPTKALLSNPMYEALEE